MIHVTLGLILVALPVEPLTVPDAAKLADVPVVEGATPSSSEPELELIWSRGMPMPEPLAAARPAVAPMRVEGGAPARVLKTCTTCYERVDEAEAERARMCPHCGEPWAG
ncbi:MAG: hypothetical protein JST54_01790 [Deltaproteobacteria bacterium]|nr:hypothetical protein [Deltaproteobacteria bacterium]